MYLYSRKCTLKLQMNLEQHQDGTFLMCLKYAGKCFISINISAVFSHTLLVLDSLMMMMMMTVSGGALANFFSCLFNTGVSEFVAVAVNHGE